MFCSDDRLPIVLWGKFATDVDAAIQIGREQQVICVVRFGKIKIWKGIIRISITKKNATCFYFTIHISELTVNCFMVFIR